MKRRYGGYGFASKRRRMYGASGGKRALPPETKYVDGFYSSAAIHELLSAGADTWADCEANPSNTGGAIGCLPIPQQGDNYADRDGRRIYVKKIRIKGFITFTASDSVTPPPTLPPVRLLVVKDTRTNAATLSAENVIGPGLGGDGAAITSGNGNALALPTNPDGWGRYKVMYDKTFRPPTVGGAGVAGDLNFQGMIVPFKITVKANCFVNFCLATGVVGAVVDNSFHVLAATIASDIDPSLMYYVRTSFIG